MQLKDIQWEAMWREIYAVPVSPGHSDISDEERYDRIAPLFKKWMEYDDYPAKLLEKIRIKPDWSVLDIGCGTGSIAIPAAKTARSVTAIDISTRMLKILESDAKNHQVSNISQKRLSWDDAVVGTDIHPHDVVIMSRSIGRTMNLRDTLQKVNLAANHLAYITAWGGEKRRINQGIMEALGQEYHDTPDYLYIVNILAQMGISPNVEQMRCTSRVAYPTIDEALHIYQILLHLAPSQLDVTRAYLENYLVKRDDGWFEIPNNKPLWTLIWWEKSN